MRFSVRRRLRGWRHVRPRAFVALLLVVSAVAALLAGGLQRVRVDTTIASFLPAGDRSLRELDRFARSFGADPVVVLVESTGPRAMWGPERLPRLLRLEGRLAALPDTAVVYGPATVLNQIAGSAQNLIAEVSGSRDGIREAAEQRARARGASADAIRSAGRAAVAEFERRYGSLLVRALPAGLPTLHNPKFARHVIFDAAGRPKPQWRFVVPDEDTVAILVRPREGLDQAGVEQLVRAVRGEMSTAGLGARRVTVSGVPAIGAALGEHVRREIPLLGLLALGAVTVCFLAVRWTRSWRRRFVPVLVMLVASASTVALFGLAGRPLSLGVAVFLPVLVGVGSDFPVYLMQNIRRRPVVVAALASAASFASLGLSPLPFVRDVGLALAVGVLLTVALAWPIGRWVPAEPEAPPLGGRVLQMSAWPRVRRRAVLGLLVVVAGLGWAGLSRLDVQSHPERLAAGLPALADGQRAERVLGSSGEVNVVLRGNDVLTPAAFRWGRQAQDAVVLRLGDRLRPALSAPDLLRFLGESPTSDQMQAATRLLPSYLTGAVIRQDGRMSVITFGLGLTGLDEQQRLLADLRASLPPPPSGMSVDVTGLPVVAAGGYAAVSAQRFLGSVAGIAVAGLVLLVGLARRRDALRAVAAAALASGWTMLALWVAGVSLTPLTVALGSLTAAVGCEYAVLLGQVGRGMGRLTQRSVLVAAATSVAGYAVLTASGLSLVQTFGAVLAVSVALSYLAALAMVELLPDQEAADVPASFVADVAQVRIPAVKG